MDYSGRISGSGPRRQTFGRHSGFTAGFKLEFYSGRLFAGAGAGCRNAICAVHWCILGENGTQAMPGAGQFGWYFWRRHVAATWLETADLITRRIHRNALQQLPGVCSKLLALIQITVSQCGAVFTAQSFIPTLSAALISATQYWGNLAIITVCLSMLGMVMPAFLFKHYPK